MGIIRPRPAIRKREIRTIEARLAEHARLMAQYEAQGMDRTAASARAYADIKNAEKTER